MPVIQAIYFPVFQKNNPQYLAIAKAQKQPRSSAKIFIYRDRKMKLPAFFVGTLWAVKVPPKGKILRDFSGGTNSVRNSHESYFRPSSINVYNF